MYTCHPVQSCHLSHKLIWHSPIQSEIFGVKLYRLGKLACIWNSLGGFAWDLKVRLLLTCVIYLNFIYILEILRSTLCVTLQKQKKLSITECNPYCCWDFLYFPALSKNSRVSCSFWQDKYLPPRMMQFSSLFQALLDYYEKQVQFWSLNCLIFSGIHLEFCDNDEMIKHTSWAHGTFWVHHVFSFISHIPIPSVAETSLEKLGFFFDTPISFFDIPRFIYLSLSV